MLTGGVGQLVDGVKEIVARGEVPMGGVGHTLSADHL